jgi:hypothetical protein
MARDDVSPATKDAERDEEEAQHRADRGPTPEEEKAAGDDSVPEDVRQHYQDMTERGVEEKGEGRID